MTAEERSTSPGPGAGAIPQPPAAGAEPLLAGDDRLARALRAIDDANADDPTMLTFGGVEEPKELLHARLMTTWVTHLDEHPSDEQQLAARAHHLRRWEMPRSDHPEGRAGYLRWRAACKRRHAELVAGILADAGYDEEVAERVGQIIRKERLRSDPDVQVHEDALCLVFLQTQLAATAEKLGDDKTVDVLRKTWPKMSERAQTIALRLPMRDDERRLIELALAG